MVLFFQSALTFICLWWPTVFICFLFAPPDFFWPPMGVGGGRRRLALGVMPRRFLLATGIAILLSLAIVPVVHSGIVARILIERADALPHS